MLLEGEKQVALSLYHIATSKETHVHVGPYCTFDVGYRRSSYGMIKCVALSVV